MRDERWADLEAEEAGRVIMESAGSAKKAALAGGVTPRSVHRAVEFLRRVTHPWPTVAYFAAIAVRRDLGDDGEMPLWRWRTLMRQALREEQEADGTEDLVTQQYLDGEATAMDLYAATARQVRAGLRRMALSLVAARRDFDLRDHA